MMRRSGTHHGMPLSNTHSQPLHSYLILQNFKEREREREREREGGRERETERERQRDRQRDRERDRDRQTERQRERQRQTDRKTDIIIFTLQLNCNRQLLESHVI